MAMGILCFSMAAAYLPVLVIAARKFALLYTLGSIFFISSFSLLYGPKKHFKACQKTQWFQNFFQDSNFYLNLGEFPPKSVFWLEKASHFSRAFAIYIIIHLFNAFHPLCCSWNQILSADNCCSGSTMRCFNIFYAFVHSRGTDSNQIHGQNVLCHFF